MRTIFNFICLLHYLSAFAVGSEFTRLTTKESNWLVPTIVPSQESKDEILPVHICELSPNFSVNTKIRSLPSTSPGDSVVLAEKISQSASSNRLFDGFVSNHNGNETVFVPRCNDRGGSVLCHKELENNSEGVSAPRSSLSVFIPEFLYEGGKDLPNTLTYSYSKFPATRNRSSALIDLIALAHSNHCPKIPIGGVCDQQQDFVTWFSAFHFELVDEQSFPTEDTTVTETNELPQKQLLTKGNDRMAIVAPDGMYCSASLLRSYVMNRSILLDKADMLKDELEEMPQKTFSLSIRHLNPDLLPSPIIFSSAPMPSHAFIFLISVLIIGMSGAAFDSPFRFIWLALLLSSWVRITYSFRAPLRNNRLFHHRQYSTVSVEVAPRGNRSLFLHTW
jgi:hypothetical protein